MSKKKQNKEMDTYTKGLAQSLLDTANKRIRDAKMMRILIEELPHNQAMKVWTRLCYET